VNVAGRVNLMVFDKTGTLTEEGLSIFGFRTLHAAEAYGRIHFYFDVLKH
jgi:magnesium-transporting ATPase (P-type)